MMRVNITWKDRRIDYLNLRDDIYQNIVPDDEAQKVWIPEIGMCNEYLKSRVEGSRRELLGGSHI